jgi:hypothetical protein
MQASRILPDLQSSLLCEEVRQEVGGNLIIIGVIGAIRVPQLPVTAYRLTLYNRWTSGVGKFTESVRFLEPDQTTVLRKSETKLELKDVTRNSTSLTLFNQLEFKTAGTHYIEVLVDDVMKLRYPVRVVVVPPEGGPPSQPQPPAPAAEPAS